MIANKQPPMPRDEGDGRSLLVHSIFYTIQGEGPFAGHRAVFVRLGGCNIQCPGCDTEYSEGSEVIGVPQLYHKVLGAALGKLPELVVITGGEPFRQSIGHLVSTLVTAGINVQIESNGLLEPDDVFKRAMLGGFVSLVVSPKGPVVNEWLAANATAYKYVLTAGQTDLTDGLPTKVLGRLSHGIARPPQDRNLLIFVQPADEQDGVCNQANIELVGLVALEFGYIAQLQIHKILNLP